ncbi:hypothetical protein ACGF5S_32675 [Nocardia nova]|uniref:nSTAND1 domain-containing NTPase n=1 Tax=Nocardia nova TaxID=37330 RepID=UPI00370FAA46
MSCPTRQQANRGPTNRYYLLRAPWLNAAMSGESDPIDPSGIRSRKEFGKRLKSLFPGMSNARIAALVGMRPGTLGPWFAGSYAPSADSTDFERLLECAGLAQPMRAKWLAAAAQMRRLPKDDQSTRTGATSADNPYRGLFPFEKEHEKDFCGRDDYTDLLEQMTEDALAGLAPRVIVVVGASGSGKSSLLAAGLHARFPSAARFSPGEDPAAALTAQLDTLRESQAPSQVLIIDQCEELWTLHPGDEGAERRTQFLERVALWLNESARVVVVGLRADHSGSALAEPLLQKGMQEAQVAIPPMSQDELQSAITRPAERRGVDVDPRLVEHLLQELSLTDTASGGLPLLSHALREAWKNLDPPDRYGKQVLTYDDYYQTGGIREAIENTAEAAFAELSAHQKLVAQRIMTRAVVLSEESTLARQPVRRNELSWDDTPDAGDIDRVIEQFAERRLITVGEDTVEVAHEALLTNWSRMRDWIESDRITIIRRHRLADAAHEWTQNRQRWSDLFTSSRTQEFAKWAADEEVRRQLNPQEARFLKRSITYRRIRRGVVAAVIAALAVAVVVSVGAYIITRNSLNATQLARDESDSRQAAVQSELMRSRDPALAQQLALAGYRISPTLEAKSALLDSTAIPTPVRAATVAGPSGFGLSSDGTLLAVANKDSTVRLIDRTGMSRNVVGSLVATPNQPLYATAFRPNSRLLAAGGGNGVSLWNVDDPAHPRSAGTLPGISGKVEKLAWTPDGTELAAAGLQGTVRWSIAADGSATLSGVLPSTNTSGQASPVRAVAYSPNGSLLATGGENATVQLWDRSTLAGTPTPVATVKLDAGYWVNDLAFDSHSARLAVASRGAHALIIDTSNPGNSRIVQKVGTFTSYINGVDFSADNTTLAVGSGDNSTTLYRLDSSADPDAVLTPVQTLPGPDLVMAVHIAGDRLLTTSQDGFVREWPLPGPLGEPLHAKVYTLDADKAANTMLAGVISTDATGNVLRQFDISNPNDIHERGPAMTFEPGDALAGVATISRDGHTAAAGTKTGSIYTWDITNPTRPQQLGAPAAVIPANQAVDTAVFSSDARYLFAGSNDDKTNHVFVLDRTDPVHPIVADSLDAGSPIQLLTVSDDGKYLAAATVNTVRLWDISSGPHHVHWIGDTTGFQTTVQTVRFGANHLLAGGSADHTIRLWRASDTGLTELAHIDGPTGAIQSLVFDQSSAQLAAGIGDTQIWIWNVTDPHSPTRTVVLDAYGDRVNDVVYEQGATTFTAAGLAGKLRTWLSDPHTVAARICANPAAAISKAEWQRYLPTISYRSVCA